MSDITGSILSFAGWAFLPRFISSFLQSVYYRITIRAGSPHPHPSSPCYARHYRRIYIFVVTSYLLYTFYDAYHRIRAQGDFYQILGVLPTADDRTIKSRFRRLAALHHPDKQGGFESTSTGDLFVHLKLAQDTLLDETSDSSMIDLGGGPSKQKDLPPLRSSCPKGFYAVYYRSTLLD
ncbi:hypothetical protein CISG_07503 [Coccidioides immitis RMSCC 3703]|uniref:J domain-containing protein n=1 Tax=Coccidioides immitis RMSCC 3703 TaxID=454286 RepID=A0A0J8R1W7_COCIT|nr:hypothetical protein CISG_07503 [Coccidioides immitis RMSCC 3703]